MATEKPTAPTAAELAGDCIPGGEPGPVEISCDCFEAQTAGICECITEALSDLTVTIGDIQIDELDVSASGGYQIEYCTADCETITLLYCKDENHAGGQGDDTDTGTTEITVAGWVAASDPLTVQTGPPPAPNPDGCEACETPVCIPVVEPGVCVLVIPEDGLPAGFDPTNSLSWGDLCPITVSAVRWYDCDHNETDVVYNIPGSEDAAAVEVLCPCEDEVDECADGSYAEGLSAAVTPGPIDETFVFAEDICHACVLNQTCCPVTVTLEGVGTWIVPAGASVDIAPNCPFFTELAVAGDCDKPGSITVNGSRN